MTSIPNDGPAGPIASQQWWASAVAAAVRQVPRDKVIVTIGNYAYDWHDGGGDPENVEEAWVDAGDSDAPPGVRPRLSGNSTFAYEDENGHPHTVWLLDAASAFNELTLLDRAGIREVALWRLGAEDPGLWSIFGRNASGCRAASAGCIQPRRRAPMSTSRGRAKSCASPRCRRRASGGSRSRPTACSPTSTSCRCRGRYTITRTGYRPGLVALTFDDGPDARWTPQILDILKAEARAGDLLHRRRERADRARPARAR